MSADGDAGHASYTIRQTFRYDYPGPIARLRHRLVIAPPLVHGDQRRVWDSLVVTPHAEVRWSDDTFGNRVAHVAAARVDDAVVFSYEACVERRTDSSTAAADAAAAAALDDPRYREASGLTFPGSALREAAARLGSHGDGDGNYGLAERINAFVADRMRYVAGATSVMTTAPEAFAQATGVCQDYAHVMVAIARACGFAARYVSGHLIGEGGTHAWVELLGRDAASGMPVVWAFDPTHRRRTNFDYVFVAAGRDYTDIAPTSGTFVAPYLGEFSSDRFVERTSVIAAA
ncbi:MAG: transglutaminase family protein [Vulcanimicrobiaceae bacterium]